MRRFIWILLLLILSVWIGLKIAADPGLALFSYRQWSVEMPLWFAAVGLIVFLLILYAILRFFDGVGSLWQRFENWLRFRRKNKSYSKTNRGLMELVEENWRASEMYLMDGIPQSDAPLINYLAAAKAAQAQCAYDRRDAYLKKAYEIAPQSEIVIGLTQAKLQLEQGQLEQALATLDHLCSIAPRHPAVLKLLERVYIHLGDWKSLLKLIPVLRKAKAIDNDYLENLEEKAYEELLKATGQQVKNADVLREIWKNVPRQFQQNSNLVYCYATQLFNYPEAAVELENLINKTLKKSWNNDLVRLYGLLITPDAKKQLATAESWLKQNDRSSVLLLTLGRLSMRCQLWGKARHYFEKSLALCETPDTCMEYARLLEQLGDISAALQIYRGASWA